MMNAAAIIENGVVVNCVVIDNGTTEDDFKAAYGDEIHVILYNTEETRVAPGYLYDGKEFTAPPMSEEEIRFNNQNRYSSNMQMAVEKISQLTDATDPDVVDEVDPADVELLRLWKRYRLALLKVDVNNPVWPTIPV